MRPTPAPEETQPRTGAAVRPPVIVGSGRSGTTWVVDSVALANGLRTVFEPLHPMAIPEAGDFAYRCLDESADLPELNAYLHAVFSGSRRFIWTDLRVRPDRLIPGLDLLRSRERAATYVKRWRKLYRHYRRYRQSWGYPRTIIKSIRANLMLDWLERRFHARIVLVMRHPGAVVESKLRLGGDDWDPYALLQRYRCDEALNRRYLCHYRRVLDRQLTLAEAHTLIWCIENQVPLRQAQSRSYTIVFYERLLADPASEWAKISHGLGLARVPDPEVLRRPSQQASRQWRGEESEWMRRLNATTTGLIGRVLEEMEVSVYDIGSAAPCPGALTGSSPLAGAADGAVPVADTAVAGHGRA